MTAEHYLTCDRKGVISLINLLLLPCVFKNEGLDGLAADLDEPLHGGPGGAHRHQRQGSQPQPGQLLQNGGRIGSQSHQTVVSQ